MASRSPGIASMPSTTRIMILSASENHALIKPTTMDAAVAIEATENPMNSEKRPP